MGTTLPQQKKYQVSGFRGDGLALSVTLACKTKTWGVGRSSVFEGGAALCSQGGLVILVPFIGWSSVSRFFHKEWQRPQCYHLIPIPDGRWENCIPEEESRMLESFLPLHSLVGCIQACNLLCRRTIQTT